MAEQAFSAFSQVDCGSGPFVVQQLAGTTAAEPVHFVPGQDNEFVISARSDAKWREGGMDPAIFAATLLWFDTKSGEVFDADIMLNLGIGDFADCSSGCADGAVDLQNTLTHEAGHALGLGHSTVAGATMEADATPGATEMRTLEADDVDGLCALSLPGHRCADGSIDCICPPAGTANESSATPGACAAIPKGRASAARAREGRRTWVVGLLGLLGLSLWRQRRGRST